MSNQHDHAHGGAPHAHQHELSAAPLVLALGVLVTYIGFSFLDINAYEAIEVRDLFLPVGIVVMLTGFGMWVAGDIRKWPHAAPVTKGKAIGWHGMIYYLGTEVMLFASLFFVWFYQRPTYDFNEVHLDVPLTLVNTAILLTSGFTLHYGLHAIQKDNRTGLKIGLVLTILLGAVFLGIQVYEYLHLVAEGFVLGSSGYSSIFYVLTGTHGLHVFTGLVFLAIVLYRAMKNQYSSQKHTSVEAFSIYWHFVDAVWIFLVLVIYLRVV